MKYLRMLLSFLLIITLFVSAVSAEEIFEDNQSTSIESGLVQDEKIISNYSIEDDFVDDTVLLVLKKD